MSVTRRNFLHGAVGAAAAGLIPFPEWFGRYGRAEAAPPFVRSSVASAAGAAMLADYRTAVAAMMAKGTGDPCGWKFQWYTHQVAANLDKATVIAGLPAPQQPLAGDMWNTCQAHFGRPLQYFLPWHRMYVYFLERIVRKASGNPDFALPYWDYMDPAQRALPNAFWNDTASALFRPDRRPGSNAGTAIDAGQPAGTINLDCLKETGYLPSATADGLCSKINQNPHGIVHTLIGNSLGMGNVPWAANDPIFWLHHCNIDRMWASWNQAARPNPSDPSWRDQQFVFADENCNRVLVKVRDFEAISPLGYRYDKLYPVLNLSLLQKLKRLRLIAAYRPRIPDPGPLRINLDKPRIVVPLSAPNGARRFTKGMLAAPARGIVRVKVSDLRAASQPGILYHLYLNLPANASAKEAQAHYLGSITFFDAVSAGHKMPNGETMAAGEGPSFSFDATALLRRLANAGTLAVTIVPEGEPPREAGATIGNIEVDVAE